MTTKLDYKNVFRIQDRPETAPRLPAEMAGARPAGAKRFPGSLSGRRAHDKILKGYQAFFSGQEDLADFWNMFSKKSETYFGGNNKNLSRYPRDSQKFWTLFYMMVSLEMEEVVNHPTVDLVVWDNGYAFAASYVSFRCSDGTQWGGQMLNRMKFDATGAVYDQALYTEDLATLDNIMGYVFGLPKVKKAAKDVLGIEL
ncbi:hypothetical protein M427DRAFT_56898 [Gonapodya prolifera JEL478]|uniref:SnoaL-like domain-containing protein n=1 Tax=Gonapodya prolifera (strain JEL478) TaxID=1344416 RepID=A0A139AEP8_GONPJ|nr:hypothetical protein M427DRAFT_56898 [Gonapodya prolifera JEL478]|eukprot:KXS15271.1 hypothetical protein M427DRAFT_56898 [Gonapodya prolifera JEL478]